LFQLSNDLSESEADVSFDIFEETELRSNNSNCSGDVGPEVARVFCSKSLSGCGKWLTRITGHKEAHSVAKFVAWEGFNIRPERCCVHESRFHFCDQVRAGEGFDLTISDDAQIWDCSFESEMNAAVSSAPFDSGKFFGSIHMIHSVQ
jgi:hypothetical protein